MDNLGGSGGHIFLTGFMGVGKSAVGAALAQDLQVPFVDLDDVITTIAGRPVAEIFAQEAEPGFREWERRALSHALQSQPRSVIATGGGTILDEENVKIMRRAGQVIALMAPAEVCWERVNADRGTLRPLVVSGNPEQFRRLWLRRQPHYRRFPLHIPTQGACAEDVAGHVRARLSEEYSIIPIQTEQRRYDVIVSRGATDIFSSRLAAMPQQRSIIVSHQRVRRLHGPWVESALRRSGKSLSWCVIPEGENSKTLATVERLYQDFDRKGVDRDTTILTFGGGVVGDVGGYAAATYMRGLPWVAVPTTLVAQLDSAIGGKVGVNLATGKNLVGTFHQPALVCAHLPLLTSLSETRQREGLIEALKCGLLADRALCLWTGEQFGWDMLYAIICRTIAIKGRFIRHDTLDRKARRIFLNLGHTVGHALERLGDFRNWSHGEAVGIGLVSAAHLSRLWGHCQESTEEFVLAAVERIQRTTRLPVMRPAKWRALLAEDKKRSGSTIDYVALKGVGRPVIHTIAVNQLARALTQLSHQRE
jgi:shikimate kinase / 3-dehydroquinate synthase